MFTKGDMVVYPAHGVGVVKDVETKEFSGADHSFYVLEILDNGMKVLVPVNTSGSVGLRAIVGEDQVDEVFAILEEKDVEMVTQTWNRRYREYMEKIKTGSVHEVAVVLRDLFLLSVDKELSYGERKMLDTARGLLVKELSLAQKVGEDEVRESIEAIFQ